MRFIKSKFIGAPFTRGGGIGAPAAAPALTSISLFASATDDGETIDLPANIIAGDLIVLLDKIIHNGTTTPVVPTGFTQISDLENGSGNDLRQIVSYKLAVGTEGGATITGMVGTFESEKLVYVFRGNVPATSVTVGGLNEQTTDANPSAQTVTAASGVAPLVVFGCYGCGDPIDPRTFTVGGSGAKDGEINGTSNGTWLAYKIYNSSPADVVVDMDDEGTRNTLQSFYIQMAA